MCVCVCVCVCCAGTSVLLVLDWRTEVFGDELLAQMCQPLPDRAPVQGEDMLGCSVECVLNALEQEREVRPSS